MDGTSHDWTDKWRRIRDGGKLFCDAYWEPFPASPSSYVGHHRSEVLGETSAWHNRFYITHSLMPNLATWIRPKDTKWFRAIFAKHPGIKVWNARNRHVDLNQMDGLLLSGGSDISPEFLRQDVPDPSVLDKHIDPKRDRWEFQAVKDALSRGLPILAICKGLQVFNVALGGTLKLDIKGHNLPEQKHRDVQPLRHSHRASHRFSKVNSAHHQAIERLADNLEVEAWSAHDGIIEQIHLQKYPFARAVQYHPERSRIYDSLFDDFFARLEAPKH